MITRDLFIAATAALLVSGCGPPQAGSEPNGDSEFRRSEQAPDPTGSFVHGPYGIGPSWYSYDSSSHALSPKSEWYRLRTPDGTYAVHVDSYYNDRGESGYFTLRTREKTGQRGESSDDGTGEWNQPRTLETSTSVKDSHVCVSLAEPRTVSCTATNWQVLLRTDLRAVPAAGFAVSNPAIYVRGHYATEPDKAVQISAIAGDSPPADKLSNEGVRLPSSRLALADSALGPLRDADGDRRVRGPIYQASGDMQLIRWRVKSVSSEKGAFSIRLRSSCTDLASSRTRQNLPDTNQTAEANISISGDSMYSIAVVELCDDGPTVVERRTSPYEGRWPSTDSFDLFVEQWRGNIAIRLAPGHLVWKPGNSLTSTSDISSAEQLPADLWGNDGG